MLGTIGFIGERLVQARQARGLSAIALADLIGVSSATISQYEHNRQSPSPEAIERLVSVLNLPHSFFIRPIRSLDMGGVAYRSMSSATKGARLRAEARFFWLKEIVLYLAEQLDFPAINLPQFNLPDDPHQIDMEMVEEVSGQCRGFWKLGDGPIADCVLLLENNGVIISRGQLVAETLDAFSQWPSGKDGDVRPYIYLGSDKESAVRSRFDVLHELGHLLLHRKVDQKAFNNNVTHRLMELQCHRFASSFLLPAKSFSRELWAPTLNGFLTLKPRWKVSIAGMMKRCEELGVFTEEQARRSWINLNRKGWRKQEPMDDRLPVELPRLLPRSMQLLVDSGTKSKDQLLSDLGMNAPDVEALCCLPSGYFETETGAIPRLKNSESVDENNSVVSISRFQLRR